MVVCDYDPRICGLSEHLSPQVTCASALDAVEVLVHLVRAVNRAINVGVLVDVSEAEVGVDDELIGLEAGRYEDTILVDLGSLYNDARFCTVEPEPISMTYLWMSPAASTVRPDLARLHLRLSGQP